MIQITPQMRILVAVESVDGPGPSHEEKAKAQGAVLTRGIQGYR